MNVYITKYNLLKILSKIDGKKIEDPIRKIIEAKYYFVPDSTINFLTIFHIFMKNPVAFIEEYYWAWNDTETFVFEKQPAFHSDENCHRLLSPFDNIYIPAKIKEKKLINDLRLWGEMNALLFNSDKQKFISDCIDFFAKNHSLDLTKDDFKLANFKNSGSKYYENCTINELLDIINKIKESADKYFSYPINKEVLYYFRNKMFLGNPKYKINDIPQEIMKLLHCSNYRKISVKEYMDNNNLISALNIVKENVNKNLYVIFFSKDNMRYNVYFSYQASKLVSAGEQIKKGFFNPFNILVARNNTSGSEYIKIVLQEETINFSAEQELKAILKTIEDDFHQPIKDVEIELGFKVFNPNKRYSTNVLEVLNFRNCKNCLQEYSSETDSDIQFIQRYKQRIGKGREL